MVFFKQCSKIGYPEEATMEKLILSEDEIVRVCERLGNEIDAKLDESNNGVPVFVGVMNGALPFFYELVKHIHHKIQLDTIKVSSYDGTGSTGKVTVQKHPDHNLEGRDVILVEDIIDTGFTIQQLKSLLYNKGANEVKVVALLDKPSRRIVNISTYISSSISLCSKNNSSNGSQDNTTWYSYTKNSSSG